MIGKRYVVDAVVLQRLQKAGSVELVLGDLVGPIQLPEFFVQGVINHVELVCTGDAEFSEVVLLINPFKGNFGGGVEIPKGAVKVEKQVAIALLTSYFSFLTSYSHLSLPLKQGDCSGVTDIERAGGTGNGDINHHVALF